MYILLITRGYPTEKYKMNGIFEFDQAKALVNAGQRVIYAAIDVRSIRRTRHWGFESLKKDGVQIEAINIPCGRIPRIIADRIRTMALRKLYKRIKNKYGQPKIIHAHFLSCGYITVKVFEKSNIPLVVTEHFSAMNQKNLNSYLLSLGKYVYPRVDKVIAVSSSLAGNIKNTFGVDALVIPNIIDTTKFQYRRKEKDKTFSFISTGSLIKEKRMDLLIEAFNEVFKGNNRTILYIFGEGPERHRLKIMINKFGLEKQIFLMGLVDRKEIAEKMSESNCFVLASSSETFGVAYIEAMAMGLPVIATRCGGPEDFVTAKNGILVPVNDLNALTKGLQVIHKNIEFYDRQAISASAKKMFAPSIIAQQLIDVYKKVIY